MAENMQPTSVIAALFGVTNTRIGQLKKEGVIVGRGNPAMYDFYPTVKAYIRYLSDKAYGREKKEVVAALEERRLRAEAEIKEAKAAIVKMEQDELEGKLHRAEDVKAITTDHVLFLRSMLMAMPGKLAVDLGGTHTAAEQAERVKQEVYYILDQLANYKYDPVEYQKRVKERQGWEHSSKDDDLDG